MHALHFVAEKVDAIGVLRSVTEDVEDRTAQRIFTGFVNVVFAPEPQLLQTMSEFDHVVRFANFEQQAAR